MFYHLHGFYTKMRLLGHWVQIVGEQMHFSGVESWEVERLPAWYLVALITDVFHGPWEGGACAPPWSLYISDKRPAPN